MSPRSPKIPSQAPRLRRWLPAAAVVLALVLVSLPAGPARAQAHPAAAGEVLAIQQSGYITEQQTFTVSMQVADPANISLAYFTFCQLTNSLCYAPVRMTLQNTNWFVGTTKPMSSYHGMVPGIRAGYNISIDHVDNVNTTLPSMPNAFPNLTVATTNVGWYMFQMTVGPQLYGLSGLVRDAATGSAVAGAQVTLSAQDSAKVNGSGTFTAVVNQTTTSASGAYAFTNLVNGSYILSVIHAGYPTTNQTVQVAGSNATQNVALSTSTSSGTGKGGSSGLLGGATLWLIVVVAAVAALAGALLVWRRRRAPPSGASGSPSAASRPPQG